MAKLVKIGGHTIDFDRIVHANDASPDQVNVDLEYGHTAILRGPEAIVFREHLAKSSEKLDVNEPDPEEEVKSSSEDDTFI